MKRLSMLLLCTLLAGVSCSSAEDERVETETQPPVENPDSGGGRPAISRHLTTAHTVRDVVEHEAFAGFGQFVLPVERIYADMAMPLSGVARLLPYHNYVTGENVVATINAMIDYVDAGNPLFYDIYSEAEKQADSRKNNTGLFFFRGKPGMPFAVVCPGGGWSYVGAIHEGFPLAMALSGMGYNAFSIQYRTGGAQVACEDLAQAIDFIISYAEELQVSPDKYSLWGGSAGARMAAYLGSYGTQSFIDAENERPATVVMGYTGHSDYTPNDPPTYVVVGENDGIASPAVMRRRVENLNALGIDAEFHLFPNLRHGFGLGLGTSAEGWEKEAVRFWEKYMD
ncbi:MAG: alpha/beta hydrolase [Bacteroides sp.]|nr:alpha/beta hydrolase [Bacteroides sp.]